MKILTPEGGEIEVDDQVILGSEAVQTTLKSLIEKEVTGLKGKNSELLASLSKTKEMMKKFEGLDVDGLMKIKTQMENDEDYKMLQEGKHKEVIEKHVLSRTEALKADFEHRINALSEQNTKFQDSLKQKDETLTTLLVDGKLREAYVELGYEPSALDFILQHGRSVFKAEADGKIVPRRADGSIIFGKDAKTPVTHKEWLEMLAEQKPFMKKPSQGAGVHHQRRAGGGDPGTMTGKQLIAQGIANHFGQQ